MLPSLVANTLADRRREYRRILFEHTLEHGGRLDGMCTCGASRPPARAGDAWHVEHLAEILAAR
jgi:hypothetical protein